MLRLLEKCSKGQARRRPPGFRRAFLDNCRRELPRKTRYAAGFARCTEAKSCDELKRCSDEMGRSVDELGAEHVSYLLANSARTDARKFCSDNRHVAARNVEFHRVCHALLKEIEEERGREHSCPFHPGGH